MLSRFTKSDGCTHKCSQAQYHRQTEMQSQAQTHHQEAVIQKVPCQFYVSFLPSKLFSVGR